MSLMANPDANLNAVVCFFHTDDLLCLDYSVLLSDPLFVLIRLEKLHVELCGPEEINQVANNKLPLTQPEIHNNERNREVDHEHSTVVPPTTTEEERKQQDAERYGFQKDGEERERPLTKINSIKLQPFQEAVKAEIASPQSTTETDGPQNAPQVNGSGEQCPANGTRASPHKAHEPDRSLNRTSSMQQLEQWVRIQKGRNQDDDARRLVYLRSFLHVLSVLNTTIIRLGFCLRLTSVDSQFAHLILDLDQKCTECMCNNDRVASLYPLDV